MIQPPLLKAGDTIGIVAPARKISKEEIQPAITLMENWGLTVQLGKNIHAEHHQFAGTDEQRCADFQEFLEDDNIKAIICARGGYGCVRIVDDINFLPLERNPKWIVGYSDVTFFHALIHKENRLETLHANMPISFPKDGTDDEATMSIKAALFEGISHYQLPVHALNRDGESGGLLIGGNLSIIYASLESETSLETEGKILFLEDVDEYLYHVDRMMMALKRAGKLEGLMGLVIGGMTGMNDNAVPFGKTAEEIIAEHVEPYDYPVAFGLPAGHIENNCALIFGRHYNLTVNQNGAIIKC